MSRGWSAECEEAHQAIKTLLKSTPTISLPLPNLAIFLGTDASQVGMGACVYQEVEKSRRFLGFASKALNAAQRNYAATKRELLAVVWAMDRYRYLLEHGFVLRTDHKALSYYETQSQLSHMLLVKATHALTTNGRTQ